MFRLVEGGCPKPVINSEPSRSITLFGLHARSTLHIDGVSLCVLCGHAGNNIHGDGAMVLAKAVTVNKTLETLKLGGTWCGAMSLFE